MPILERTDATSFLGRDAELEELAASLEERHRLVTITGPAGVGKTRVARRAAQAWCSRHAGLASGFADLTAATDLGELCAATAGALDVPLAAGESSDLVTRLGHAIAIRGRSLLVLDNLEHLGAVAGEAIGEWLALAPELHILGTSRERTRVPGENVFELRPLAVPSFGADAEQIRACESVALFRARSRALRSRFEIDDSNVEAIAELMRMTDGLPLAIELCAARMNVLSPAQLQALLADRRLDVLRERGLRAGRHETLRATLDWSWQLLSPLERSALAQAAAFRGGFTLEAARAVIVLEGWSDVDLIDTLQNLVDKSLLRLDSASDGPRYGTYESVLAYAAEKLRELSLEPSACERHQSFFLRSPVHWWPPAQSVVEETGRERPNLLAVYERAMSRGDVSSAIGALERLRFHYLIYGPWKHFAALIEKALAALPPADADADGDRHLELRARAENCRATHFWLGGFQPLSFAQNELPLRLRSRTPELVFAGRITVLEWLCQTRQTDEFLRELPSVEALAEELRDPGFRWCVSDLAVRALRGTGGAVHALLMRRELCAEAESRGWQFLHGVSLLRLAWLLIDLGERGTEVRRLLDRIRAIAGGDGGRGDHASGWTFQRLYADFLQAELHRNDGDLALAAHVYESALPRAYAAGFTRTEGVMWANLAEVELDRDRPDAALAAIRRARIFFEAEGDTVAYLSSALEAVAAAASGAVSEAEEIIARLRTVALPSGVRAAVDRYCAASRLLAAPHLAAQGREVEAARSVALAVPFLENGAHDSERDVQEMRYARALIRRAYERIRSASWLIEPCFVIVHSEARWFRAHGCESVDLSERKSLRLMLDALVAAHKSDPDRALDASELFGAGWPGERALESAQRVRVRVAIRTLRKLGLGDAIETRGRRYAFSRRVIVTSG